jgi:hypothetical protein
VCDPIKTQTKNKANNNQHKTHKSNSKTKNHKAQGKGIATSSEKLVAQ